MSFVRSTGEEQNYPWIKHEPSVQKLLDNARAHINADQFEEAHRVLEPLIRSGNPEALYLGANLSRHDETADEFDRRHLQWIMRSADQEYPPALFVLGVYYDVGDMVALDKTKAAQLFKRAAELKHAQSQCIHGTALLYGAGYFEKDERSGLEYIIESARAKFEGALEFLADFYEKGKFGFPIDLQKAASLRAQARGEDVIGY